MQQSVIGVLTRCDLPLELRSNRILLSLPGRYLNGEAARGYEAILSTDELAHLHGVPRIVRLRDFDHFRDNDILVIEPKSGFVRSLYRPAEKHHSLFVTERCNSNCLMCSQPPKDVDDTETLLARNRRLIELMRPAPSYLTITGGEPTLSGKGLFQLLDSLKRSLPDTQIHMLTNGRTFAWSEYTRRLAAVGHPNFSVGIPLYSDSPGDHDYIVQAKGAFDQTIAGLHQLARFGVRSEIRVVLHKLTIPRLTKLVDYVYRNLTFVEHVALMGLEHVGYTPRNIDELWIDPADYQGELLEAVEYLTQRDVPVSLYNQQLCVLDRSLWDYAPKAISDWKNAYLPECESCAVLDRCGGLFQWALKKHSQHICPIQATAI